MLYNSFNESDFDREIERIEQEIIDAILDEPLDLFEIQGKRQRIASLHKHKTLAGH